MRNIRIQVVYIVVILLLLNACGIKKVSLNVPQTHPCIQEAQDKIGYSIGSTGVGYAFAEHEALRRATFDARNNLFRRYSIYTDTIVEKCKGQSLDSLAIRIHEEQKKGITFSSQIVCSKIYDLSDGAVEVDVAMQSPITSFIAWIVEITLEEEKDAFMAIIDEYFALNGTITEKAETPSK